LHFSIWSNFIRQNIHNERHLDQSRHNTSLHLVHIQKDKIEKDWITIKCFIFLDLQLERYRPSRQNEECDFIIERRKKSLNYKLINIEKSSKHLIGNEIIVSI
jgi:hypothetical protein